MSLIVFVGVNLVGDPVDMLINPEADQFEIDRVIRELGLDRPVAEQYWYFMINAFQGDLGRSFVFGEPALKLIIQRMPATMELALFSLFIAISFGIPLGVYAGLKPTSKISRTIMASSILGFSMPTFWVGIILIMFFSVNLGWLPSTGRGDVATYFGITSSIFTLDGLSHLFLPACLVQIIVGHQAGTRWYARSDFARLHQICARQGTWRRPNHSGSPAEKYHDSDCHCHWLGIWIIDRLFNRDRNGLCMAGHGQIDH